MSTKLRYYKIILAGSGSVGKTAIRHRYFGKGFNDSYAMTLGADFALKRLDGALIQIWDLAGQPMYQFIRKEYYIGLHGVILVFDHTKERSFDELDRWVQEIITNNGELGVCILVGNKVDLVTEDKPGISEEKINKFIENVGKENSSKIHYIRSSALTGENIDYIFNKIFEELTQEEIDPSMNIK